MSYQVLARKWRPQNFQELVGQEHVQRALVNALNDDRLHHAYLFTGTRGVGKTTIARIFSKSLNCETGITSTPCGKCSTCVEIAEGRYVDLIEVDAASRTGVDDTRDLLENVQYAPTRGRYKVYLIDEVHMFSKSSFNALLKTLEEPPPHVKFLLATTDPQKLPVTILSRCLQFNLKRLPVSLIISHLQHILTEEKVEHNVTALQLIAEAADGSMRDALSLLDQALAFGGGSIQEQEVRDMLGSVSRDKVIRLLKAVLQRDAAQAMAVVAELAELSPDFENALAEFLSLLHHMSLAKTLPEALDEFVSAREDLLKLCEQVSAEDLHLFYQIALIGRRDLPLSPDARNGFEMIVLRMLAFRPAGVDVGRITQDQSQSTAQATIKSPAPSQSQAAPQSRPQAVKTDNAATVKAPPVQAQTENAVAEEHSPPQTSTQAVSNNWRDVVNSLGLGGLVKQLAINCTMQQRDGCNIVLHITSGHSNLINPKAKQRLQQALGEYFNVDAKLEIKVVNKGESVSENETPAQTTQRETDQRQQQAVESIDEDSFTQVLKESFNAEIIPGSVKPGS
ncbi:MAG: DNA polymerase III subunit gamma/tau [Proteobacteria bacterium]|nr:DNA polymerase III subunit gamma/tau [Pseudomonadota bacterium]